MREAPRSGWAWILWATPNLRWLESLFLFPSRQDFLVGGFAIVTSRWPWTRYHLLHGNKISGSGKDRPEQADNLSLVASEIQLHSGKGYLALGKKRLSDRRELQVRFLGVIARGVPTVISRYPKLTRTAVFINLIGLYQSRDNLFLPR